MRFDILQCNVEGRCEGGHLLVDTIEHDFECTIFLPLVKVLQAPVILADNIQKVGYSLAGVKSIFD